MPSSILFTLKIRSIEPLLYRYPAVDPGAFRRAVEATLHG
jgi:hypothetical protein